ncbi:MAG: hypothetical protein WB800_37305, partial [Streptosporangiaceae bacterium]
ERRYQHPSVPDRHQFLHPRLRLSQQQPDRIPRPAWPEFGVGFQWRRRPGVLSVGRPVRAA